MRFADIIGQQQLKRQLVESIERGRISHAQLFSGAAGAGTLPLALAYAQYLNCQNRHDGDSCGECPSCVKMQQLAHPDLHFVFPVNKQGKKSDEVVLSGNFMDLWREIVSQTGGYFTRQQWNDRLDLGKTLKGMISAREADEIIRRLSFKSFESEYKIMIILKCLFILWFLFNIPLGFVGITVSCLTNAEFDKTSIFLYPLLIETLREELNKVGTAIVAVLFSIFFMPAIIIYFILLKIKK